MSECPDKIELGKRLRALRKRAGFRSAKAFAEFAGFTTTGYAEFEQGRSRLTYEKAWKIADALGISLDELGGREWPRSGVSADPRRRAMIDSYDALTDDGKTLASEAVASMARDPLRRADTAGGAGAGPRPAEGVQREEIA
ncbi:helix-turn-helix transcriptional regulator [Enorma massiliensis]|uniref:helix-turn-helix domain-containing protein n=1 Tax=Enorma massiliensis TaxID=1472761 RepID=UPI001956AC14|nr:helix-turn-helix transcriptional regulator [Enorma massiliensis]MBM6784444.1 helix-turn-helix transcriptional regulator [Enorma massiliensis]